MKRFEYEIALGTVIVTVFEDRTVIELVGRQTNETDQLYQIPFNERARNAINAAMDLDLPSFYGDLRYMEPEGHA